MFVSEKLFLETYFCYQYGRIQSESNSKSEVVSFEGEENNQIYTNVRTNYASAELTSALSCKHTEHQAARSHWNTFAAPLATWKWVWDPFWSVIMHSNGTLPLDAPLDARCVYALRNALSSFHLSVFILKTWNM